MGEVPHYLTIKRDIQRLIRDGQLLPHVLLPGRWKLTEQYGCSWATVNRAIQELILEGMLYAEKGKGTFVSPAAPGRAGPVRTLSVLLCSFTESVYHSVLKLMQGIHEAAGESGVHAEFTGMREPGRLHDLGGLDGRIVITPGAADYPELAKSVSRGERFVVLGSEFREPGGRWVSSDTREGTRRAVGQLLAAGHRRILLFGLRRGMANYEQKARGYELALTEYGLKPDADWMVYRPEKPADAEALLGRWMGGHPACSAVFAADYTSGLAVLGWAMKAGVRIPRDLSLFVMGEVDSSPYLVVPPSSVVQPFAEMGRQAVRMALGDDDDPWALLPCRIIDRQSVQPPSGWG
ncbi:GntR family transcriptional regulator [Paenibacillus sp. MWE-103]|uniref:GntR family transcriptional regulator n=1 Tax=Paenibacillus artemisiicola TaxID=1172618 RepID=A0ABS3WIX6_9BACL|nr:GntR family transcriptional regulator [Paenibacillus artemisiicola]MBO7748284.1 GntR family transcriptional regulator [Paenibacillus artemisiicola]